MDSPYASWMDRYHKMYPEKLQPQMPDEASRLIAEHGRRHEREYLEQLMAEGRDVCRIEGRGAEAAEQTAQAMRAGREIIYQAYLHHENFAGQADFLRRVDGNFYEPWDTKLARHAKPSFAVQLCCYCEMLGHVQGRAVERFHVVLGDKREESFRLADHEFFYRTLKQRFLEFHASFDESRQPEPEPMREHRKWTLHAEEYFERTDHLCRVADIHASQIKKLRAAGIETLQALSVAQQERIPRMDVSVYQRLRHQAALQRASTEDELRFELLPPVPKRGLDALPPPSQSDVYFDMEGYPFRELEYLFGAVVDEHAYLEWWAHDGPAEKRAFEAFVDWVHARWEADRRMHVYHYAAYEKTALRRLAGRHGTREEKLDALLRNEVFVDLFAVVRHGVRVGGPNYSIKTLERVYRKQKRATDVASAVDSIVAYERWLDSGQPQDWHDSPLLENIREYNKDDCISTVQLACWLRGLKADA